MGIMHVFKPGALAPETRVRHEPPALEELQRLVGGYIELVGRWTRIAATDEEETQVFVNEDGIGMGLAMNPAATQWLEQHAMTVPNMLGGLLRGTVVVLIGEGAVVD